MRELYEIAWGNEKALPINPDLSFWIYGDGVCAKGLIECLNKDRYANFVGNIKGIIVTNGHKEQDEIGGLKVFEQGQIKLDNAKDILIIAIKDSGDVKTILEEYKRCGFYSCIRSDGFLVLIKNYELLDGCFDVMKKIFIGK